MKVQQINMDTPTLKTNNYSPKGDQSPGFKINIRTAQQQPRFYTAQKKQRRTPANMDSSTQHRLKLKDYLRLTTITKRSASNQLKKRKNTLSPQNQSPQPKKPMNSSMLDTQKSLQILKQELKSDLHVCLEKMTDLVQKVENSNPKLEKPEEEYQELVFLCELHRIVKETLMGNLDKANNTILQHKQKQIFKFTNMAKQLLGSDIKKSTYLSKRRLNTTTRSRNIENSYIEHKNQPQMEIKSTLLLKI